MILLFGGTTEGKQVAELLDALSLDYIYSTKSKIPFSGGPNSRYRYGAMNREKLSLFCQENKITTIINAAHPFASLLHSTISELVSMESIKAIRYERAQLERTTHPNVIYLDGLIEVLHYQEQHSNPKMLNLSGVKSLVSLEPYWRNHPLPTRISASGESVNFARQLGFPHEQLIIGVSDDEELLQELIDRYAIEIILTKESGTNGFLQKKIKLALKKDIRILILKKPLLPEGFLTVSNAADLKRLIV